MQATACGANSSSMRSASSRVVSEWATRRRRAEKAVFARQAFQHDPDLLFSRMVFACGAADIVDVLFSRSTCSALRIATMSQENSNLQVTHSVPLGLNRDTCRVSVH